MHVDIFGDVTQTLVIRAKTTPKISNAGEAAFLSKHCGCDDVLLHSSKYTIPERAYHKALGSMSLTLHAGSSWSKFITSNVSAITTAANTAKIAKNFIARKGLKTLQV